MPPRAGWLRGGASPDEDLRARQQPFHLSYQLVCSCPSDGRPGDQCDVVSIPNPGRELPPRCPEDSPGPVAVDRAADAATGHRRDRPRARHNEHYHPLSVERPAGGQDTCDIVALGDRGDGALADLGQPMRTDGCGPWRGDERGWPVPHAFASGCGIRAAWPDAGCSADRSAWTSRCLVRLEIGGADRSVRRIRHPAGRGAV